MTTQPDWSEYLTQMTHLFDMELDAPRREELERQYLLLDGNGELARRRALRLRSELLTLVREGIEQRLLRPLLDSPMFAQSLERFQSRTESPYRWAEEFVTQISGGGPGYELHKS